MTPTRRRKLESVIRKAARTFKRRGALYEIEDYEQVGRETLIRLETELEEFETDENAALWLFKVVYYRLFAEDGVFHNKPRSVRARRFVPARTSEDVDEEYSIPYDEESRGYSPKRDELRKLVVEAVKKNPGRKKHMRARVVFATLMNYKKTEIARRMGASVNSVDNIVRQFAKEARIALGIA